MKFKHFLSGLALCLLAAGMACAQGVGASGDIRGTVTDPSGAVVPNATVVATDVAKGIKHTATADNSGSYVITNLPPATYDISAARTGFGTSLQKGVIVNVGETVNMDFHLKVSQVSESIEVTTEAPVVEVQKGEQADTIDQKLITDLPINRRDYLTFTLLAPGVSDSTRLADNQDFRVKQTPQSGLSFYGSNGRGNSVTVDGGEANDDAGGVRLTLSQDAVQEFQINRSNYGADLGGASGASINIVSRSGSNAVHGSLYGFFRNDGLDARDPFAFSQALQPGQTFNPANADSTGSPLKNALDRQQFGGTIGFPIRQDKTFLFTSFEGLRSDAQNAVPILTNTNIFRPDTGANTGNNQVAILNALNSQGNTPVNCGAATQLPASVCAGVLQNILTVNPANNPVSQFLVNQFENNGGVFPFNTREYQTSARLDHQFNENNSVMLRYSFAHDNEQDPDVTTLTGFSRGSNVHAYDNTFQGSWFRTFSPRVSNELRAQWNYSNFDVIPNEQSEVGLDIPGFANFGTNIFLPSFTIMRRYEVADNITVVKGHHAMKMGGYFLYRGNHTESHTFFPGRFVFGTLPGALVSPCLANPAGSVATGGCGLTGVAPSGINALQSAALGLPQFYEQGFGNPIYNYPRPFASGFWQDQWAIRPNLTFTYGVRYELDAQYGQLSTDKDNFAPRVSFAWDPFGDHKTVVRGGYGIFYSPIYGQIGDVVQTLGNINGTRPIANFLIPLTGAPGNPALSSAAIFKSLFGSGKVQCTTATAGNAACVTPADLAPLGLNVTNTGPLPPLTVLFSGQPGYQSPYSQQAEFGIEREISPGTSISVSGIYSHTLRLPTAIDKNVLPAPISTVTLANGQTTSFQNWAAPSCVANPFSCFVNPLLLQSNQYSSQASALYEGAIFEIKKRFSRTVTITGNYTYSKAFDTSTDFNSDFGPVNNLNLAGERGLSDFDQRHKVVVAAVLDSPWKSGKDSAVGEKIVSGFELSPIVRYNSPHPFDLLAGADVNGDRHSTNDRPIGAARNTGIGPDFVSFDMRLSRAFKVSEKSSLQFLVEGFNILNRTNYASVNNEVGPNFGLPVTAGGQGSTTFNVHGTNAVGPSSPLGFTSAFDKRQLQLGVRLSF